jgi:hypothetical protein
VGKLQLERVPEVPGAAQPLFLVAHPVPYPENRDPAYESARDHTTLTWQKWWWQRSGDLYGLFLRELCEAWSCTFESLLAPVAQRNWSDTLHLDDQIIGPVSGYLLHRPPTPEDAPELS